MIEISAVPEMENICAWSFRTDGTIRVTACSRPGYVGTWNLLEEDSLKIDIDFQPTHGIFACEVADKTMTLTNSQFQLKIGNPDMSPLIDFFERKVR